MTYAGCVQNVDQPIRPYFLAHPYKVKELTKEIIFAFYEAQLSKVKVSTVKHYHAVIHGALNYAVDKKVIPAKENWVSRYRSEGVTGLSENGNAAKRQYGGHTNSNCQRFYRQQLSEEGRERPGR